jgi:2-dehydropantoate 2-reductase
LLDPTGALWATVGSGRVLGGVVCSGNEVLRPGAVPHTANNRWLLGDPRGVLSDWFHFIADLLRDAELYAEAVLDIRTEVWARLLRYAPMNAL